MAFLLKEVRSSPLDCGNEFSICLVFQDADGNQMRKSVRLSVGTKVETVLGALDLYTTEFRDWHRARLNALQKGEQA